MTPEKIGVLGVGLSRVDYNRAVEEIIAAAKEKKSLAVTALAVHGVMEAFFDKELRRQINSFFMVTPDGQPVRWAVNLLGARELKDRVSGPLLMEKVCERAAVERVPIFLFGSTEPILEKMKQNLIKKFPGLIMAGTQADRFREATAEEDQGDIETINRSGACIVFVGRGCPRQERWAAQHVGKVDAVLVAVGAAFDFLAGSKPHAPKILQDLGLEWMFRLVLEPKRLWKRYLLLNPMFIYHAALQILKIRNYEIDKSV